MRTVSNVAVGVMNDDAIANRYVRLFVLRHWKLNLFRSVPHIASNNQSTKKPVVDHLELGITIEKRIRLDCALSHWWKRRKENVASAK